MLKLVLFNEGYKNKKSRNLFVYQKTSTIFATAFGETNLRYRSKKVKSLLNIDKKTFKIYCGVEQLVARWAHNPKVARSSRVPATKKKES